MPFDSHGLYYLPPQKQEPVQGGGCFDGLLLLIFLVMMALFGIAAWGVIEIVTWVTHK